MKLERDLPYTRWIATQGMWYGVGRTRPGAVADCISMALDALLFVIRHRGYGLQRWWYETFVVGDD